MTEDFKSEPIGYGRPPKSTRFQKGQSGNAKGRPRGKSTGVPYDAVLGQLVTVKEDGMERKVTASEAFLLHLAKEGLKGKASANKNALRAIAQGRLVGLRDTGEKPMQFTIVFVDPGNPNLALIALGMGRKLDASRPTARTMLEPWVVEAALVRLGERRLSIEEQAKVRAVTRTPHKVNWPDWWDNREIAKQTAR